MALQRSGAILTRNLGVYQVKSKQLI